jgi:hypothetical protein
VRLMTANVEIRSGSDADHDALVPAIRLWPELELQLHQAPDPGAVGAEVGSTLAAASWTVARSTPSSSAHRCSGAAIGRPESKSCQVPTGP